MIDAVIVHYHSAGEARDAIAALRIDGNVARILVADNGSTPDECSILQAADVEILDMGRNAGYAGAINAAFAQTTAEFAVVMNEDVIVQPGCLAALRDELARGAAVAGPLFFWERSRTLMLPCTEERTRRNELLKVCDPDRARSAWRAHARRHWTARDPLQTVSLSGALLAFRRDTWQAVGPFDEEYPLYFEENDWLMRVDRAGLRCVYVPAAQAIHLHKPALAQSPQRLEWQARSFQRFGDRYYGARFMRRLAGLASRPAVTPRWDDGSDLRLSESLWLEVSPSPAGFPAAAARLEAGTDVAAILRHLDFVDGNLYLQLVDDAGNVADSKHRSAATASR